MSHSTGETVQAFFMYCRSRRGWQCNEVPGGPMLMNSVEAHLGFKPYLVYVRITSGIFLLLVVSFAIFLELTAFN